MYIAQNCSSDYYLLCTISAPAVSLAAPHNLHTPGAIAPPGLTLGPSPSFIPAQNKAKLVVCLLPPIKAGCSWSVTTLFFFSSTPVVLLLHK